MTLRLLTLLAVADLLCLSPHTVRAMARDGRLRPIRICRRLLFDPADIERLIRSSTEPTATAAAEPLAHGNDRPTPGMARGTPDLRIRQSRPPTNHRTTRQ
jgi:hypothetical protein